MPRLRVISGRELVRVLVSEGFTVERIVGSHYSLKNPYISRLVVIPVHNTIAKGTFASIVKEILPFVSEKTIKKYLYR